MKKANGHGRTPPIYKSYVFKTKDPAIDQLRTVAEDYYGHRIKGKDLTNVQENGGPSAGCMRAWFFGKTKRPQNASLEAAGRAMGYERVWRRMRPNE